MMKSLKAALAATTAFAALSGANLYAQTTEPAAAEAAQTEDERLSAFFEEVFQRNLANSPIFQAQLGMKTERYGEWDDFSDEEATRQNEETKEDLNRLRTEFDYDALSEQSKVSYRIFEFLQERDLEGFPYRFHSYAFSTMNNPATFPATFLQNIHRVDSVSDAEAYISRIEKLEVAIDQLIEGIDMAVERGIVPTSFSFDPVLEDSANMVKGAPFDDSGEDNAVYADFKTKVEALEISDVEKPA